jgi:hypothetical protein
METEDFQRYVQCTLAILVLCGMIAFEYLRATFNQRMDKLQDFLAKQIFSRAICAKMTLSQDELVVHIEPSSEFKGVKIEAIQFITVLGLFRKLEIFSSDHLAKQLQKLGYVVTSSTEEAHDESRTYKVRFEGGESRLVRETILNHFKNYGISIHFEIDDFEKLCLTVPFTDMSVS